MNRRTFIKLTGITTLATIIPAIARLEPQPQWIKYTDQMPKIGQNIIALAVNGEWIDIPRCHMVVGKVEVDDYDWSSYNKRNGRNTKNKEFAIKYQAVININGQFEWKTYRDDKSVLHYTRHIIGDSLSYNTAFELYQKKEFDELDWINPCHENVRDIGEWKLPVYGMKDGNRYWMPITKLPKTLPPFPKYISTWSKFLHKQPKHDDYIEEKDQDGCVEKAYVKQIKTLPYEPERFCLWLKKDADKGYCNLTSINKKYWAWRYVA